MKKLFYILLLLVSTFVFAQNKGITYQAVIYIPGGQNVPGVNVSNVPMTNKSICLQFSFLDASAGLEYQEVIKTTTDEFGMVNVTIGSGNQTGGYVSSFDAIVWSATSKKTLKVALDATGLCNQFEALTDDPLASVPFANAAITAENVSGVVAIVNGGTGATTASAARTNLGLGNVENTSDLNKPMSTATKIYVDSQIVSSTIPDATTTSKGKIQLAGDLAGTAAAPTVPGLALKANSSDVTSSLATKENASNKSTDATLASNSDVKFPTEKAVKTYVDVQVAGATIADASATVKGKIQLAGDLAGTAAAPTVPGLGLKENAVNKSTMTSLGTSDVLFPTQNAVKTYVDTAIAGATIVDADATTKGKLQLAGDLAGTAAAPVVANNAITDAKIANGISASKVGLGNVNNTSDANKPVSTATQTALDLKANLASPTFTGTVSGIDKTMVGLSNLDNTSDANKPVSTATQTALDLKANLASPTFTGTVSGIDKTMVGLSNVDNTTDANKPVSTATQTALDLKANLASPTFTGTVSGIDKTMVGLSNVDNTTDANKPVSTATQTAIDLKENLANKSTDIAADAASTTKYPSVKVIKDYVDALNAAAGVADGSITSAKIKDGDIVNADVSTTAAIDYSKLNLVNSIVAADITSEAVETAKIKNANVTYAKIQNVSATDKVLGRVSTGSGVVEEIATIGSGNVVRATSPTLVTPALGTPSAAVLTNATGLPLTSGVTGILPGANGGTGVDNGTKTITLGGDLMTSGAYATTLTATAATSVILPTTGTLATLAGTETLTNKTLTSPTMTAPTLGVATATSVNKVTITAPTTSATLTIADGKTLTANNSIVLAGTDGKTMTFPTTDATIARTDAAQTFTGVQTFSSTIAGSITGNAATVTTNANLTGDVTSVGNATTIGASKVVSSMITDGTIVVGDMADNAVETAKIKDAAVTDAKLDKVNIPLSGFGAATADVALGGKKLTGVANPTAAQDVATKSYVDTLNASAGVSDGSITYAKIQNVSATDKVLGRVSTGAGVVEEIATTGSGNVVRATSPTLVTPVLGAASATSVGFSGSTSGTATLAAPAVAGTTTITLPAATGTLATLAGTETLTNKTLTSPTMTAPVLGTPASGTLTNATGLPLTSGVTGILPGANGGTGVDNGTKTITLGGNLTTSGAYATNLTSTAATSVTLPTTGTLATLGGTETLTNKTLTSPTLTTPTLGVASATSVNGLTPTALATGFTIAGGSTTSKTLTVSGDATVSGTTSGTNTGDQTITLTGDVTGSGTGSFAATIGTGKVTTATIAADAVTSAKIADGTIVVGDLADNAVETAKVKDANITYAKIQNVSATDKVLGRISTGAGVVEEIATTGSGNVVRATSPTLVTPTLGVASATSVNGLTPTALATGFTIAGGSTTSKTLTVSGDASVSGTNTGDQTTITGNAGTATKLAATKNINGVAFDGSADITVTADATTLTGTSLKSTIVGSSLTSVGTLTNLTVTNAIAGSITGNAATVTNGIYTTSKISDLAATTSAELAGKISDETGSGTLVFATSPTLTTPTLGVATATSVGFSGSTSGTATLAAPAVAGTTTITLPAATGTLATLAGTETLTNKTLTSPILTTPALGVATATSVNKVTITAPTTSATLTIADGKTLTASNDATVSGTNTGDQTITLTGDVTGTGTGSFATTIGAAKVTNAMLAGSIDLTSKVTGILPVANGGTGSSTQNFVDLTTAQTVAGVKTFSGSSTVVNQNLTVNAAGTTGQGIILSDDGDIVDNNDGAATFRFTGGVKINNNKGALGTDTKITLANTGNITATGSVTASQLTSNIATGTAPLVVTSTTPVANLSIGGNAATATKLATARKINTVDFDGTADITVTAAAGTLTGNTLASNVVSSSLTSVGTIATGTWNGTTIAIANGGTGQTTKTAAFDALSPMTTAGDIIYGGTSGSGTRLAKGTDGQVLVLAAGVPKWSNNIGGGVLSKTDSYDILATDSANLLVYSGSATSKTIKLPSAVTVGAGREITIKNIASVSVSIAAAAGNLISDSTTTGATSLSIGVEPSNNWIKAISDGTNWIILRALF